MWPTTAHGGYTTPAIWRVPNALEKGTNQKCPTNGVDVYMNPVISGDAQHLHLGDKVRCRPQVGMVAT